MGTNDTRKFAAPLWSSRTISLMVSYVIAGYITYYCTDMIGLDSAIVGVMFLAGKIIDAITNFIAAYIVDNTHFKLGKGRPWEFNIVFMWITTVLIYTVPNSWGDMAKYIMIFLYYTLINAVFGTILTCTDNIYFKHAFIEDKARNFIQAFAGGVGMIAMMAATIVTPALVDYFEKIPNGWVILSSIFAVPMSIIGMIRFFTIPEVDTLETSSETEHVSLKETIQAFVTNKYVVIMAIICFGVNVLNVFNSTPASYYFTYIVGDLSKQSLAQITTVIAAVSLVACVPLANKFGRVKVLAGSFIVSFIGCIIRFFASDNMILLMISNLLIGICTYPFMAFAGLLLIDSMDYGEWKSGKRLEGAVFAGYSLGSTIGTGVGSSICGIVLKWFGYNGMADTQSTLALFGIKFCYSLIPAILLIMIFTAVCFYDLEKKMPQIKKELEQRKER